MKISVVVGGSMEGSFVLNSKDLANIRVHTKSHDAVIWFHHCEQIAWFISKFGYQLEDKTTPWGQGVKSLSFEGNSWNCWSLHIDTNLIPLTIIYTDDK